MCGDNVDMANGEANLWTNIVRKKVIDIVLPCLSQLQSIYTYSYNVWVFRHASRLFPARDYESLMQTHNLPPDCAVEVFFFGSSSMAWFKLCAYGESWLVCRPWLQRPSCQWIMVGEGGKSEKVAELICENLEEIAERCGLPVAVCGFFSISEQRKRNQSPYNSPSLAILLCPAGRTGGANMRRRFSRR